MTLRAAGLGCCGALLVLAGALLRWPELTGLGAAGLAVLVLVALTHAVPPRVAFAGPRPVLRATRGQPLELDLPLSARGATAALRLAVGDLRHPLASYAVPRGGGTVRVAVDTSRRGDHRLGPFHLVHSDPWGLVRRRVDALEGGTVTVLPRVRRLTRGPLAEAAARDSDSSSRRAGEDHFHALRDYVLGDEPRKIHWRSTARAGRLVVRQEVAATSSGTAVVLDLDVTAYGTDEAFSTADDPERFETAVDVAASVAAAQARSTQRVHMLTTARGGPVTTTDTGAPAPLVEALAVVRAMPPVATSCDEVVVLLRRLRPARVVLVTGTPPLPLRRLAAGLQRSGTKVLVVRVRSADRHPLNGVRVVDVEALDDF